MRVGVQLRSDSERLFNKPDLPNNIALCQPSHLPFTNHVHCLVAFNRPQRAVDRAEPEAGRDSFLHETMVLLQSRRNVTKATPGRRLSIAGPTIARASRSAMSWKNAAKATRPMDTN